MYGDDESPAVSHGGVHVGVLPPDHIVQSQDAGKSIFRLCSGECNSSRLFCVPEVVAGRDREKIYRTSAANGMY